MTKVNPRNGNETKSDIFYDFRSEYVLFKSDIIFQWSQNTKIFQ